MKKNFSLSEMVMVVTIMVVIASIISTLTFSGFLAKKTGEHEAQISSFFLKEKKELFTQIEEALIICSFDARIIEGDSSSICENKDSLNELTSDKQLFFKSKDNKDYLLEFKNKQLVLKNLTDNEEKSIARKVEGFISYHDKNLYKIEIEFLDENKKSTENKYPMFIKIPNEY